MPPVRLIKTKRLRLVVRGSPLLHLILIIARIHDKRNTAIMLPCKKTGNSVPIFPFSNPLCIIFLLSFLLFAKCHLLVFALSFLRKRKKKKAKKVSSFLFFSSPQSRNRKTIRKKHHKNPKPGKEKQKKQKSKAKNGPCFNISFVS